MKSEWWGEPYPARYVIRNTRYGKMIDVNREGEVWVFAEQHNGKLEDTPVELMSKARHLADTLGVKLAAVLLGDGVRGLATQLIHRGADKAYVVENPLLQAYQTNSYAKVMFDLIHKHKPQIVLYGPANRRPQNRQGQEGSQESSVPDQAGFRR